MCEPCANICAQCTAQQLYIQLTYHHTSVPEIYYYCNCIKYEQQLNVTKHMYPSICKKIVSNIVNDFVCMLCQSTSKRKLITDAMKESRNACNFIKWNKCRRLAPPTRVIVGRYYAHLDNFKRWRALHSADTANAPALLKEPMSAPPTLSVFQA